VPNSPHSLTLLSETKTLGLHVPGRQTQPPEGAACCSKRDTCCSSSTISTMAFSGFCVLHVAGAPILLQAALEVGRARCEHTAWCSGTRR
jgi:hypothetical protein